MTEKEINKKKLQKYGEINLKLTQEGDGYYFWGYESLENFNFNEDLKKAFKKASDGINNFKSIVEKNIIEAGGEPEEWEM